MRPRHPVPIVFAFDRTFARYCTVALCSIALHSSHRHDFICLYDDMEGRDRDRIAEVASRFDCRVEFLPVDLSLFDNWHRLHRFGIATYFRIAIFRQIRRERVLYLDVDTITTTDITVLLDTELRTMIGACLDRDGGLLTKIPMRDRTSYFNAGVMLIDPPSERDMDVYGLLKAAHDRFTDRLELVDQCLLNHVFEGAVQFLPGFWNKHLGSVPIERRDGEYSPCGEPAILHFSGGDKPWMIWSGDVPRHHWLTYARIAGLPYSETAQSPRNDIEWLALANKIARKGNRSLGEDLINRATEVPAEMGLHTTAV